MAEPVLILGEITVFWNELFAWRSFKVLVLALSWKENTAQYRLGIFHVGVVFFSPYRLIQREHEQHDISMITIRCMYLFDVQFNPEHVNLLENAYQCRNIRPVGNLTANPDGAIVISLKFSFLIAIKSSTYLTLSLNSFPVLLVHSVLPPAGRVSPTEQ